MNFRMKPAHYCLAALTLILIIDILGMMYLLNLTAVDAVFYTITTLATVGFEAPPNLTTSGKVFMVFVILTGFGIMGYAVGQFTQYVVSERILFAMGRRRDKALKRMTDHWILCGAGRVGKQVGMHFMRDKIPFVIIESSEDVCSPLIDNGWNVILGNATDEALLTEARIEHAAGLVASLSDDADNVYITLCARSLNRNLRIIARANDTHAPSILYRAGADKVINPIVSGADAIASAAVKPKVAEFFYGLAYATDRLELEFDAVHLASDSSICGKTLAQANLRSGYGTLVLAISRDNMDIPMYSPPGDFILKAGDELLVLTKRENLKDLHRAASAP